MFRLSYLNNKIQLFFAFISRICRNICDTRSWKYRVCVLAKMAFLTIFMQRPYAEPPGGFQKKIISCPSVRNLLSCMDCPRVLVIWCHYPIQRMKFRTTHHTILCAGTGSNPPGGAGASSSLLKEARISRAVLRLRQYLEGSGGMFSLKHFELRRNWFWRILDRKCK